MNDVFDMAAAGALLALGVHSITHGWFLLVALCAIQAWANISSVMDRQKREAIE